MKIPKRFELHGKSYTVRIVPGAQWKEDDCLAFFRANTAEIEIKQQSAQMMEHSFWHELVHAVLDSMNEERLYRNEKFVDVMAALLMQAMKSAQ